MRCGCLVLLISLICSGPCWSGAWLRDHETAFSAVSVKIRGNRQTQPDYETGFYLEYGLMKWLTLGLDFNETPGKSGHALLFARLPLVRADRRTRIAVEIGAGGHHRQGEWAPFYKAGLAVGRGFTSRWGNGWMAAETAVEYRSGLADPTFKLDAVAGLSSGPRFRPLIKLETAYTPDRPFGWAITPGVMFEVGNSTLVVGVERRSAARDTIGLTLGLWRRF